VEVYVTKAFRLSEAGHVFLLGFTKLPQKRNERRQEFPKLPELSRRELVKCCRMASQHDDHPTE